MALPGFFGTPNMKKLKRDRNTVGLIKALGYQNDPAIRREAAEALGEMGDPRAVSPLIRALSDEYEKVCVSAFRALWQIGTPAVEPLMAELRNEDCQIHETIARALQIIGEKGAVEPLVAALGDRNERIRTTAAGVLAEIGLPAVPPLIDELRGENIRMQKSAGEVLATIGTPAVKPLVTALMPNEPALRERISVVLGAIGRPAVAQLSAALISGELRQRHGAAEALGIIGDPGAVPSLMAALDDMHPDVHLKAAEAIQKIGSPAAPCLIAALNGGNAGGREHAKGMLEQLGPSAVEPLILALAEENGSGRDSVAGLLGRIGDPRAVEPLAAALDDGDEHLRMTAIEALIRIGDMQAKGPLLRALRQDRPGVRNGVLQMLDAVSPNRAGDPLIGALYDELRTDAAPDEGEDAAPLSGTTPTFQKKVTDARGNEYELFRASSPEKARAFLTTKSVDLPNHYLIVETPDGTWGRDRGGLFLDHLDTWHISFVSDADCEGTLLSWGASGLEQAARGAHDNFVGEIECGKCKYVWTDGLRYQNVTAVRCPGCNAVNRVDSSGAIWITI